MSDDEEARAVALQCAVSIRDGATDAEAILADARVFYGWIRNIEVEVEVELEDEEEA